ncbi:MAG: winged helix-turn-helix domain-containing protein, partial [Pseudomonadota bacterium]
MSEPVPQGPDVARRVEIDRDRRRVTVDGRAVALGARAFDVLRLLADHSGDVVSKAQILDTVWGGLAVEEGNLSVQISALRKVLGAGAIATVPGIGYQLVALDAPAQSGPKAAPPPLPDKPSLVVLPFANLTGGDDTDYLVDGIVRDVITALTRISALFVIAATTSFRFKGQAVDLAALGQQLGVRYAVEGSVQKAGDRLRIAVHLVATETGHMIWSEQVDGATTDLFDLQDEIAGRVAGAVEPTLMFAEANRSSRKPTEDLQAYDLVLRALPHLIRVPTLADFRAGIALLD